MELHGFLGSAVVLLGAAVIGVPLASRLGLGSVLGYLLAGVAIGPWGLGLLGHAEDILHFSELGVALLLFLIGLELNPGRLWALRRAILGMGGAQVLVTMGLITGIGVALGVNFRVALVAGMGLSLSSTAIALQTMNEKNLLTTPAGHSAFSVLLFQDLAVIPMLAVVPLLGRGGKAASGPDLAGMALALGVVIGIVVAGRFLIRPLFRIIALTDNRDLFTAFSLLLVMGAALLMDWVGMSMALGTFLGGVVLAESEYRHELEIDIGPFKGLLMGLFFISVGMSVDFAVLASAPLLIVGLALGVVLLKLMVLAAIARVFGFCGTDNALFSVLLSQGGEFGFVLFGAAAGAAVLPAPIAAILIVVVALTMLATPLLLIAQDTWLAPRLTRTETRPSDTIDDDHNPVIIAGFGRFGQIVARLLHAKRIGTTVLDHDPNQIDLLRRFGYKAFYGDATRLDLLEAAGARNARVLVLALDDTHQALAIARLVRKRWPALKILARARNRQDVYEFMKLDVALEDIARETFGSALDLGQAVLRSLDYGAYRSHRIARRFRRHDVETIQALFPYHQDELSLISKGKEARLDLERLMNDDEAQEDPESEDYWNSPGA